MRDEVAEMIRKQQRLWRQRLAKQKRKLMCLEGDAYADAAVSYLMNLSSEKRIEELICLVDKVESDCFWKVFLRVWPMCDRTWWYTKSLSDLLMRNSPAPLSLYDERQRSFFDNLPPIVTIYRGCDRGRMRGLSWSTDRKIAERFAWGHRGIKNPDPVIAAAEIKNSDLFAVCADRCESEVIGLPTRILAVENLKTKTSTSVTG